MKKLFFVGLSLALFGAGCPSSVPPVATPPAQAPVAVPPAIPKPSLQPNRPINVKPGPTTQTVTIRNFVFEPQTIAINAGDSILWVNKDSISHTTASDGALIWDSGNIAPGQSYKRVFSSPGTYNYHCGIHASMKGTVVVH